MSKKNSNVILRNYFKQEKDFSEIYLSFKKKINKIKKKSYVIAISGGPDSLALAAMSKVYSLEKKIKLHFVLVDHNLRKKSSQEADQVKKLLRQNDIKLTIIKNLKKFKTNIQNQARVIRYKLLLNYCLKKNVKVILTAHNLEDQVETFLIRLSRGSGLTGLSSMKQVSKICNNNVSLFRPLLDIKKKYLIRISRKVFGKYFKDPSNKNKKFLRTKIRSLKKPLEKSGIKYDQIIKSINNLASINRLLDQYTSEIIKKIILKKKNVIILDFKNLQILDDQIKLRVINYSIKSLRKNYYNPRYKKVDNLIKNLENGKFNKLTLGGCLFTRNRDKLFIKEEKK